MGQKLQQNTGDAGNTAGAEGNETAGETENGDAAASEQGSETADPEEQAEGNDPNQGEAEGSENAEGTEPGEKEEERIKVKALYLTGWTAGSSQKLEHYVELANATEINAYVVDIKDDDGYVGYESQVPEVRENGTWKKKYDAEKVLKAFHDNGIYVIGRLVVFKDPVYSLKRPDLAVKHVNGAVEGQGRHNMA